IANKQAHRTRIWNRRTCSFAAGSYLKRICHCSGPTPESTMLLSRRAFLQASLAGLASTCGLAADKPATQPTDGPSFKPNTLFLTWQRDPTTTMTIQWIGTRGETADTTISYSAAAAGDGSVPQVQPTVPRPYPNTDFKVFRAELTGLSPGTDYRFRIGKQSA